MSSSCVRSDGTRKRTYASKALAKAATRRYAKTVSAYLCPGCNGWHLCGKRRKWRAVNAAS